MKLFSRKYILVAGLGILGILVAGHFVPVKSEGYLNDYHCFKPITDKYRLISGQKAAFDKAVEENVVPITFSCDVIDPVTKIEPKESRLNLYLW